MIKVLKQKKHQKNPFEQMHQAGKTSNCYWLVMWDWRKCSLKKKQTF